MTGEDLCKSFAGDTLFTIQAPTGTQLELPPPDTSVIILFCLSVFLSLLCWLLG